MYTGCHMHLTIFAEVYKHTHKHMYIHTGKAGNAQAAKDLVAADICTYMFSHTYMNIRINTYAHYTGKAGHAQAAKDLVAAGADVEVSVYACMYVYM